MTTRGNENAGSFRWNYRKVCDGERMIAVIKGVAGKRLSYKPLAGGGLNN